MLKTSYGLSRAFMVCPMLILCRQEDVFISAALPRSEVPRAEGAVPPAGPALWGSWVPSLGWIPLLWLSSKRESGMEAAKGNGWMCFHSCCLIQHRHFTKRCLSKAVFSCELPPSLSALSGQGLAASSTQREWRVFLYWLIPALVSAWLCWIHSGFCLWLV